MRLHCRSTLYFISAILLLGLTAQAHADKTVRLTKLHTTDTTESGEDEVYIEVLVDGATHRLPSTGFKRMNEDDPLESWPLNAVFTVKKSMIISVYEDDDSSGNDLIGLEGIYAVDELEFSTVKIPVPVTENGGHSKSWNDEGEYTVYYEVSDAPADLNAGFTMAIMSDPQYDYCESSYCADNAVNSAKANEWHSASIEKLKKSSTNFMGVIVNGDLTNTMDDHQLDNYRKNYASKFTTYPGLGNHDYENYTPARGDSKNCSSVGILVAKHYCAKEMVDYIVEVARSNPAIKGFDYSEGTWSREGSLAYYWDIGEYRFIQLQNHPAFENEFSVFMSNRAGHEDYVIKPSLGWLKRILTASTAKKVILNMHGLHASDALNDDVTSDSIASAVQTDWERAYTELQNLLGVHANVVAIFAGHIHKWAGEYNFGETEFVRTVNGVEETYIGFNSPDGSKTFTINGISKDAVPNEFKALGSNGLSVRTVPVYFTGSSEFNKYLKVDFEPNKMTVRIIDSRQGAATELFSGTEVNIP